MPFISVKPYVTGLALFVFLTALWILIFFKEKESEYDLSISGGEIMKTVSFR